MLLITISIFKNQVIISGHSYSADPGFDIVCAGVSSLACGAYQKWLGDNAFKIFEDPAIPSISFELKLFYFQNIYCPEYIEFTFLIHLLNAIALDNPKFIRIQSF